jgi:hypothetical protein
MRSRHNLLLRAGIAVLVEQCLRLPCEEGFEILGAAECGVVGFQELERDGEATVDGHAGSHVVASRSIQFEDLQATSHLDASVLP